MKRSMLASGWLCLAVHLDDAFRAPTIFEPLTTDTRRIERTMQPAGRQEWKVK